MAQSGLQVTEVGEGAPIQQLRAAQDGTLAVQRSSQRVEVYHPRSGAMFVLVRQGFRGRELYCILKALKPPAPAAGRRGPRGGRGRR